MYYSIPSVKIRFPNTNVVEHVMIRGDVIGYHGAGTNERLKIESFHEKTQLDRRFLFSGTCLSNKSDYFMKN